MMGNSQLSGTSVEGYFCQQCGAFVPWNTIHTCGVTAGYFMKPEIESKLDKIIELLETIEYLLRQM